MPNSKIMTEHEKLVKLVQDRIRMCLKEAGVPETDENATTLIRYLRMPLTWWAASSLLNPKKVRRILGITVSCISDEFHFEL